MLIGLHTDPDEAVEEMEALVDVHTAVKQHWDTDDILIMGDLNADCSYASETARNSLELNTDSQFSWLIGDEVDTTTTSTDCTYDRCVCSLITHLYAYISLVVCWTKLIIIIVVSVVKQ